VLPRGKLYTHPVSTLDILPTVLSAAGAEPNGKTKRSLDGINLLPYLSGERDDPPHGALYWKVNNRCWAIRQGDWKLVRFHDLGIMLFHLADDRGETRDLAMRHPEIVQRLEKMFRAWESQLVPAAWKP
jgi:arylsulfatase A-like enzyme